MFNNISPDNTLPQNVEGKGEMETYNLQHISRLDIPIHLTPQTSTFDDIALHAHYRQRTSWGTINRNLRYARFMEKHTIPVNFANPTFENYIQHMDYREQIEECGHSVGKHEWQTMKMFLTAWGIPHGKGTRWYYKPPPEQETKTFKLITPDQVNTLIKHKYHKDPYTNALIQYLLLHNFNIGWRVPSEPPEITTDMVDTENSLLSIKEPKKRHSIRTIILHETLMNSRYRKSLRNWIDIWRPKIVNQHSHEYLYLTPQGKPFQTEQLRMFLNRAIKPICPTYHPNISRYWCGTGIFIKQILKTHTWDKTLVERQLGHEGKDKATNKYLRTAEIYLKLCPFDWFKRILKAPNKMCGENPLKINTTPQNPCFEWKPFESNVRRPPTANQPTGEKPVNTTPKNTCIEIFQLLTKIFSSFFITQLCPPRQTLLGGGILFL